MKCFNHNNIDAVGICKKCAKGICVECAVDLGHGLACKGAHEADVEAVEKLVARNIKATTMHKRTALLTNFIHLLMGVVFLFFGFYNNLLFAKIFGGLFISYWLYLSFYNSQVFKKLDGK